MQKYAACCVAMEARETAHYWARTLATFDHDVHLIAPKFVKACVKNQLGYPTKNTLTGWSREYARHKHLPSGSAPRPPKFSEAERQVALDHYARHGRGLSWTMRALGYPGRATLTGWLREAFSETRTVSTGTGGAGHHFAAVNQAAVVGLYSRTESAEALAKKVGVSRPTLYAWKIQSLSAAAPATMRRKKRSAKALEIAELERQRDALQRDIGALQIENDLLKTASERTRRILAATCRVLRQSGNDYADRRPEKSV